ncbi:MAG: secreted glycosyl hydrolase, partial [Flavobacteriales bacterium]|nr:secreted glycosyl hydrolase [Candidatus Arcticimaribacter sp.]
PVVWYNCVGKGKSFYSALGHKASYYDEPYYQLLLTEAVNWAGNTEINCDL